jgi:methylmalonyl-CoA decarboxylase
MALIQSGMSDGIGTIGFDNYAHRNALSAAMVAEVISAFTAMRDQARVVVLRAATKNPVWSAGHDLHELSPKGQDPFAWRDPLEQLLRAVRDFPGPFIAMIDGSVWGGACDLALDCDIVLGDEGASFAFVPAKIGLPCNLSGVQRFLARLPPNVALEMACTADPVDAQRNHLMPAAELEARTYAIFQHHRRHGLGLLDASTARLSALPPTCMLREP